MNLKRRKEKTLNTVELRDRQLITDFGWVTLAIAVGVLIPGIIMWLLFGYDFSFSVEVTIGSNGELFRAITTIIVLITSTISALSFYFLKICKADIFLFSIAFFSIYVAFFYTGQVFKGTGGKEVIFRFLISLASGAVGTIIGTMLSWYVVNLEYKEEEEMTEILKRKEENKESLSAKEIKKVKRHEMHEYKLQAQQEHDQKILNILNSKVQSKLQQEAELVDALNKKEELERQKDKDNI
ncbi:DxFTY motif-containing membrane protein [Spiroplasma endosymbiont of Othius punctulatus]|uniref:DxFTY motif-containing membrane protein n=1 Tax=Spiroplasma endosymbiont of Othius punctulatus TaxID=3066289 RepID=UPI0030D30DD2